MEQTTLKVLVDVWACSINKAIVLREKALNKTKLTEISDLCVSDKLTLFFCNKELPDKLSAEHYHTQQSSKPFIRIITQSTESKFIPLEQSPQHFKE